MKDMQLIVLLGGKASRLAPLSYTLPKGLLPIGNKPSLYNMITDYVKQGLKDIILVVSPENQSIVKSFFNKTFGLLNIKYIVQENPQGPLHAFSLCKDYITKPTLLLLGDTQCETNLDYSYDWLGYVNITDQSHSRWCLIKTNAKEEIQELIDKPNFTPETNKVLIGLYNFRNPELLKEALSQEYNKIRGEYQLSSMIEYYMKRNKMKAMLIKSWIDTGTLKDYNDALKKCLNGREFNAFHLDDLGVMEKRSEQEKLKSEIYWLKKISNNENLSPLIPKIYSYNTRKKPYSYKIDYVNSLSLAEYFLYYDIKDSNWVYIFSNLIDVASLMWDKKAPRTAPDIKEMSKAMYLDKTIDRIAKWERKDILKENVINCNGQKLFSFNKLLQPLKERINKLIETSPKYYSILHGDICFSNVLYSPQTSTFKFVDPRGNFSVDTIYGDNRYDIAKMRHCYHGLYDYITQGLYELKIESPNTFEYHLLTNSLINPLLFDEIIKRKGYDINDIELIEGLLFISMIPLHKEDKNAQIMFYLTGLKCLNNQLKEK